MEVNKTSADPGIGGTTVGGAEEFARRSLGAFLRLMRDRVAPSDTIRLTRRRAVGMRREEVALEAGISTTWYTWLEQGRPVRVSRRTLEEVARALRLDTTERAHLLRLADAAASTVPAGVVTRSATTSLRRLVDSLDPHPAYAVNGLWDLLHANALATELFGDFHAQPGVTDNILRRLFLDPGWRERFADHDAIAASAVAQFRAGTGHMVADPAWLELVDELGAESPEFAALWSRHALEGASARTKLVRHPTAGDLALRYSSSSLDGEAADVRVVVYTAEDEASAQALRELAAALRR